MTDGIGTPVLWALFGGFVLLMLALDLFVVHRHPHAVKPREALIWSGVWIALAVGFSGFLALQFGTDNARTVIKGFAYYWGYEAIVDKADPGAVVIDPSDPRYPKDDPNLRCAVDAFCAFSDQHGTASQRMYNGAGGWKTTAVASSRARGVTQRSSPASIAA